MNKRSNLPFAGRTKSKPLGSKRMSKPALKRAGYNQPSGPFAPKRKMASGGCMNCGGKIKKK